MVSFKAIRPEQIRLDKLFYPWERTDWAAINEKLRRGDAVCITDVRGDLDDWNRTARLQLGVLNMDTVHDWDLRELWIVPKGSLGRVVLDDGLEDGGN